MTFGRWRAMPRRLDTRAQQLARISGSLLRVIEQAHHLLTKHQPLAAERLLWEVCGPLRAEGALLRRKLRRRRGPGGRAASRSPGWQQLIQPRNRPSRPGS